jgi:hypothetical protein
MDRRLLLGIALTALALAPAANATITQTPDVTDTRYQSILEKVVPVVAGVRWKVIDLNDEVQLTNHSGRTVTVYAYPGCPSLTSPCGGPYARILGDGTVQVNENSPAYYLNQSFFVNGANVPKSVSPTGSPADWVTLARTATYTWHDHRIHYTSLSRPTEVTDPGRRTFVENWYIPIRVGSRPGYLFGKLYWLPQKGFSFPIGAIIGLIVVVVGGAAFVVVVRRRRGPRAPTEAW